MGSSWRPSGGIAYKKAQQEMHDAIHFKFTNTWRVGLKRLREEEEQQQKKEEDRYQKV